jgi:hypothetical protein
VSYPKISLFCIPFLFLTLIVHPDNLSDIPTLNGKGNVYVITINTGVASTHPHEINLTTDAAQEQPQETEKQPEKTERSIMRDVTLATGTTAVLLAAFRFITGGFPFPTPW